MSALQESAPTWQGRGAGVQANASGLSLNHARALERTQYRLSCFALALDAVLPDLCFLDSAVQTTAHGLPLSQESIHRLHRLALKLFDLRQVLEWPLPPEI